MTTLKRRVLYIISPGHSGSTLLTLLLATHPEIATIGERKYLKERYSRRNCEDNHCLCGSQIQNCTYLGDLFELGRSSLPGPIRESDYTHFFYGRSKRLNKQIRRVLNHVDYGRNPGFISKILSTPTRQLMRANLAIIDRVLELEGGSIFLDGSKSTVDLAHMTASKEVDVTIIHLSRDGRGQFHSMLRSHPEFDEAESARIFERWYRRIKRVTEQFDGQIIRVRYEDLCDHPLEELQRIARELGIDPNGMTLEFRKGASHAIGNERLMKSDTTEIEKRERWRTELTDDQLAIFEKFGGEANRSLGYSN